MDNGFFRTRALFWSFWASFVFILGMIGYLLMDGLGYMRPNTVSPSLSPGIYIILAASFVVDSTFQLLSIYNTNSSTYRYYFMATSCIFDALGSQAYFLGAAFDATTLISTQSVWSLFVIGACGFAIGALINMMIRGPSMFYSWANILNLLGSLIYLLVIIISFGSITKIIVIVGDLVYLVDAVLYMICWFSDRQSATLQGEQTVLVTK